MSKIKFIISVYKKKTKFIKIHSSIADIMSNKFKYSGYFFVKGVNLISTFKLQKSMRL